MMATVDYTVLFVWDRSYGVTVQGGVLTSFFSFLVCVAKLPLWMVTALHVTHMMYVSTDATQFDMLASLVRLPRLCMCVRPTYVVLIWLIYVSSSLGAGGGGMKAGLALLGGLNVSLPLC
jgi:hypothetical protein